MLLIFSAIVKATSESPVRGNTSTTCIFSTSTRLKTATMPREVVTNAKPIQQMYYPPTRTNPNL